MSLRWKSLWEYHHVLILFLLSLFKSLTFLVLQERCGRLSVTLFNRLELFPIDSTAYQSRVNLNRDVFKRVVLIFTCTFWFFSRFVLAFCRFFLFLWTFLIHTLLRFRGLLVTLFVSRPTLSFSFLTTLVSRLLSFLQSMVRIWTVSNWADCYIFSRSLKTWFLRL